MEVRALILCSGPRDYLRSGRTLRSLRAAGLEGSEFHCGSDSSLSELLSAGGPVLLVRAGSWFVRSSVLQLPASSATGKGLCALGVSRLPGSTPVYPPFIKPSWREFLQATGGDFSRLAGFNSTESPPTSGSGQPDEIPSPSLFPDPVAMYLDSAATSYLSRGPIQTFGDILRNALGALRVIHYPVLDVYEDDQLRILQVITALQRGGAERMVLDLVNELKDSRACVQLAMLGQPIRQSFPIPAGTIDLAKIERSREARLMRLTQIAVRTGVDVVHGHLIRTEEARRISKAGFPLMLTVHNSRPGWPEGLEGLNQRDAHLLAACSQCVEAELRKHAPKVTARTVWNGINLREFGLTPEWKTAAAKWRRLWGFSESDLVLVSVANPRPQKRLDRLPAVLASLRSRLPLGREARLVICGEAMKGNPESEHCVKITRDEVAKMNLEEHVRWTGSVEHVSEVLAAADVLVSTSSHEGLSLAQLEALALGCSVVATDVGGAREIARNNPDYHIVHADAKPYEYAARILESTHITPRTRGIAPLSEDWSRTQMAVRYSRLYPRVIAAARSASERNGIWLVTNNFSTGGAQSSARRLLVGLKAKGIRVRAAVVEENPSYPTPGRQALIHAGIPVLALQRASSRESNIQLEPLLTAIDNDPPKAVVFWNLRPACKVQLADLLLDVPIYDVSPGEMYFESLAQFFARPGVGFPYRTPRDYGARLSAVIVKYQREAPKAAELLGAPVRVVPNGVPLDEKPWKAHDPASPIVFGTAARINPQKRLEDLIEAFRLAHQQFPACTLKIAGGVERGCDEYAASLHKLADGLPIEWLGETNVAGSFLHGLDVFVMISEPAGCPNASLEAMAAGLPVVATDVGGASEQVISGVNGYLLPRRDAASFSRAILTLAMDARLREKMGKASLDHLAAHFSINRMIEDYRKVFQLQV